MTCDKIQDGTVDGYFCVLLLSVLFVCLCCLWHGKTQTWSREQLWSLKNNTPPSIILEFMQELSEFLEILTTNALTVCNLMRRRRRGRCAGGLCALEHCGFHTLFPYLFLSNLCSRCNKMEELLINKTNKDVFDHLCFMETWFSDPTVHCIYLAFSCTEQPETHSKLVKPRKEESASM